MSATNNTEKQDELKSLSDIRVGEVYKFNYLAIDYENRTAEYESEEEIINQIFVTGKCEVEDELKNKKTHLFLYDPFKGEDRTIVLSKEDNIRYYFYRHLPGEWRTILRYFPGILQDMIKLPDFIIYDDESYHKLVNIFLERPTTNLLNGLHYIHIPVKELKSNEQYIMETMKIKKIDLDIDEPNYDENTLVTSGEFKVITFVDQKVKSNTGHTLTYTTLDWVRSRGEEPKLGPVIKTITNYSPESYMFFKRPSCFTMKEIKNSRGVTVYLAKECEALKSSAWERRKHLLMARHAYRKDPKAFRKIREERKKLKNVSGTSGGTRRRKKMYRKRKTYRKRL